jgi:two-component system sensor histidine kinase FlrB
VFRERGVLLRVDQVERAPIMVGSRKPLVGALVSLLENALQVSPSGGEVALSARFAGREIRISVRDQGPGIAADLADRVFEPFFTTRAQGTGLGLAIALGVAKAHGGSIEVVSAPGAGSEFVFVLPAVAGAQ